MFGGSQVLLGSSKCSPFSLQNKGTFPLLASSTSYFYSSNILVKTKALLLVALMNESAFILKEQDWTSYCTFFTFASFPP